MCYNYNTRKTCKIKGGTNMAICENCGREYDISEDKDKFNSIYSMDIDNIIQDMCFDCASSTIESQGDFRDCDNCGKRFDFNDADDDFVSEYGTSLDDGHFNGCLCFECANSAWEDREYYEVCENCGIRFHVGEADSKFESECGEYHLENGSRYDYGDLLCADCALEKVREEHERLEEEGFFDD